MLDVARTPQSAAKPSAAPTAAPASAAVSAETARRTDIQQSLYYSGDIRARQQINVLPKSSGRVQQVLVDSGSQFRAGDSPAVLDQDSAQIGALQARATLAGAQARLGSLQADADRHAGTSGAGAGGQCR